MLDCIFTIDYEIYGNGEGSLKDLVYDPTQRLMNLFDSFNKKFVAFVEAVELQQMDRFSSDPAIALVKEQIKDLHRGGFEIGLHIHPQWFRATFRDAAWILDDREYNMCVLGKKRIAEIVNEALSFIRNVLNDPRFTPVSFRAGNWLLQPTEQASIVLADAGIKIDSSVFKGGLQHYRKLDYRQALKNGFYWNFSRDVTTPTLEAPLIEVPIHTKMVPFWKMATKKRVSLQNKAPARGFGTTWKNKWCRLLDLVRPLYPLKFDFCRMTLDEMIGMMDELIRLDRFNPQSYKPIVLIGHSKDLDDFETVQAFLSFLSEKNISISTFNEVEKRVAAS